MFNRIWKKFTIALLIVSFIPIGYFAYHDLEGEKTSVVDEATRTLFLNTLARAKDIEMSFANALRDVNYLRSNLIMQLFNDIEKDGDDYQYWEKMMESEFSIFLTVKPGYSSIGLLDEFGNEVVVVYRVGDTIVPMLDDQKKNRVNSIYYVEAAMLERLGVAAIPLRSEIDPGLDLKSFTLIRYATKIYDSKGKAKGVMYLDLNSVEIFNSLSNTDFKKRRPVGLLSGEGNYLYMPFTEERTMSQNLRPLNISKDYPENVLAQILSGTPGLITDDPKNLFAFHPVYPQPDNRSLFYVVFDRYPRVNFGQRLDSLKGEYLVGLALALILCVGVAIVVSHALTRELAKLREGAENLRQNRLDYRLDIKSGDEIESLANAYNTMADALQDYSESLEKKVEERSKHIQKVERKLVEAEKLAAVGFLAAGVAHEINNPVTIITNRLELVMKAVGKGDTKKLKADLDVLYNHTKRIGQITGDLLVFSRMKSSACEAVDLNKIIKRIVRLVEPPIKKKGIELKLDLAKNLPLVWASEMGIDQVGYNILYNAYHATDANGTVSVRTSLNSKGCVEMNISDNGKGIPKEILQRIFEPFFTTKEVGQGTGLGLSISYGIIQEFGGSISVDSELGKGTLFTVTLDRAEERKAEGNKKAVTMDEGRNG